MDDDFELLGRWRAGANDAGNALFQRHFDSISRFFENKLPDDVDELVQATFLSCVRGRDQFRGQSSFRTYLFTIARHELYAYLRRRRRDGERFDFAVTSMADLASGASRRMARAQEHQILLLALRALPVEQQTLLELYYWEEASVSELADIFDITPVNTRARLTRARRELRGLVEKAAKAQGQTAAPPGDFEDWARALRRTDDES